MGKMHLEGEFVKLKKPIAVMSMEKHADGETTEYFLKGVVRSKFIFRSRPVPASRPACLLNKRTRADEPVSMAEESVSLASC